MLLAKDMYDALPDVKYAGKMYKDGRDITAAWLISNNYFRKSRRRGMATRNGVDFFDNASFGILNIPLQVLLQIPRKP